MSSDRIFPLKYVALKTIQTRGRAYNEDITKAVLALREKGVEVRGINYYYTPSGPCSPEVQTAMGMMLNQDEIEELSPARITQKGIACISRIEKEFEEKAGELKKVQGIISKR